jgi:hypothetical protein
MERREKVENAKKMIINKKRRGVELDEPINSDKQGRH